MENNPMQLGFHHFFLVLLVLMWPWEMVEAIPRLKTDYKSATVFRDLAPYNGRVDAEEAPAEVTDSDGRCKVPKAKKGKKSKLTLIGGIDIKSGLPNPLSRLIAPPNAKSIGTLTALWQALLDRKLAASKAKKGLGLKANESINRYQAGSITNVSKPVRRLSRVATQQTTLLRFLKSLYQGKATQIAQRVAASGSEDEVVRVRADGLEEKFQDRKAVTENLTDLNQVTAILSENLKRLNAQVSSDTAQTAATLATQLNRLAVGTDQLDNLDAIIGNAADLMQRGTSADYQRLVNYFATDAGLQNQLSGDVYLTYPRALRSIPAPDSTGILRVDNFTIKGELPLGKGTRTDSVKVNIYQDGALLGAAKIDQDGIWNYEVQVQADGTYQYAARGANAQGNEGAESESLTLSVNTHTAGPTPTPSTTPLPTSTPTPGDQTPPRVTSTTPPNSAADVALNTTVSATFSEVVTSVTASTFALVCGTTPVAGSVSYDSLTHTATFTPASQLPVASACSALISTGVKDLAGNQLAGDYRWTFTTVHSAWIAEAGSMVKVSSAQDELLKIDTINCSKLSGISQFAWDQKYGKVWVSDTNNNRVIGVDENGGLIAIVDQYSAQGTAVDPRDGSFWSSEYVTAVSSHKLIKRNSIGLKVLETQTGLNSSMMDNAMAWYAGDNSLWFADYGNYIYKLWGTDAQLANYNLSAPSSAYHLRMGPLSQAFELSSYLGGSGHIWVADRNAALIKYGINGTELFRRTVSAIPGFYEVRYVSTDISDGSVWVGAGNPDRIAKYSSTGDSLYNGAYRVATLEADPFDGGVWVGNSSGLSKLSNTGQQKWSRANGAVSSIVLQTQAPQHKSIYVNKDGNDVAGDGSAGNAYLTIGKGMTIANDGDKIMVGAGTYNENINLKKGVAILGAGPDITTIQGLGTTNVIDGAGVQSVTIAGFTITGAGNSSSGIYCASCDGLIIRECRIIDNGNSTTSNGILLIGETSNALIDRNIISGNAEDGVGIIQGHAIIRNNIIARNKDSGIYANGTATSYIVNNVIDGNGTVTGGRSGIMTFNGSPVIKNNIISNNGYSNPNPGLSVGIYVGSGSPSLSYNNVYNNFQGAYTGATAGTGDIASNPLYVNAASGDYRLQTGSPSINTGDPALHDAGVACTTFPATRSDMGVYGGPWGSW